MTLNRTKNRLAALLLIPAILWCAGALGPGASAVSEEWEDEESGLDAEELFAEAEQDLEALTDLSGAEFLTVSDGQDVDIRASGVWVLDGAASEVTINVDAPEDAEVYLFLNGLSIVNRGRPCVYVGRVGKIYLIPVDDCSFTVSGKFRKDPDRKANAAIYSCTDLTLCGEAKLTVDSSKNGIVCRDKLRILEGDYEIRALSKAIAADNAIWIAGGDFRLQAGSDGLHAENDDDRLQGSVCICGGHIEIDAGDDGIHGQALVQIDGGRVSAAADEGIESTWVLITGGTTDIRAASDGINAGWKSDACRPKIEITGGYVSIAMAGKDADALDSNADLIISGGTVRITGGGVDYEGELDFSGGTVILDGKVVREIPNSNGRK